MGHGGQRACLHGSNWALVFEFSQYFSWSGVRPQDIRHLLTCDMLLLRIRGSVANPTLSALIYHVHAGLTLPPLHMQLRPQPHCRPCRGRLPRTCYLQRSTCMSPRLRKYLVRHTRRLAAKTMSHLAQYRTLHMCTGRRLACRSSSNIVIGSEKEARSMPRTRTSSRTLSRRRGFVTTATVRYRSRCGAFVWMA